MDKCMSIYYYHLWMMDKWRQIIIICEWWINECQFIIICEWWINECQIIIIICKWWIDECQIIIICKQWINECQIIIIICEWWINECQIIIIHWALVDLREKLYIPVTRGRTLFVCEEKGNNYWLLLSII